MYANYNASTIIIYYLHAINPVVMPNTTTTTTARIGPTIAPTGDPIEVNNLKQCYNCYHIHVKDLPPPNFPIYGQYGQKFTRMT